MEPLPLVAAKHDQARCRFHHRTAPSLLGRALFRIAQLFGIGANASQHLAVLRSKQIVAWRKDGNQVLYSLRDPRLGKILDLMRQYFQAHLHEALGMLEDMETDE